MIHCKKKSRLAVLRQPWLRLFALAWLFFSLMMLNSPTFLRASEPSTAFSSSRVLLLRNGQMLSGQISYAGANYHVLLPTGEIRIRASEVEYVCQDIQEALVRKYEAIEPGDLAGYLRLTDWCIEHELFVEADRLLVSIENLAPPSARTRVKLTRRNLEMAQNPVSSAPPVPTLDSQPADGAVEGAIDDAEALDRLTRNMPEGTVETYRRTVQPILMAGCAAARCHGNAASNEFRLIRPTHGHIISRRATQRNLQAILRWIDLENVSESPLLSAASRPHGAAKEPVLGEGESVRLEHLSKWVSSLASQTVDTTVKADPPDHIEDQPAALSQSIERSSARVPAKSSDFPRSPGTRETAEYLDPWDPAIFNRRYHNGSRDASR